MVSGEAVNSVLLMPITLSYGAKGHGGSGAGSFGRESRERWETTGRRTAEKSKTGTQRRERKRAICLSGVRESLLHRLRCFCARDYP